MKTKIILLAIGCLLMALNNPAHAQGTAITYQGVLSVNGAPANGTNDFTFSLFGVVNGGSALAGPLTNLNVRVTNGLFTVAVDFGSLGDTFYASDRWLEIATRPASAPKSDGPSSCTQRQASSTSPKIARSLVSGANR